MIRVLSLSLLAFVAGAVAAGAAVLDVGGDHYADVEFSQTYVFRTTGTYTQHRMVLPTAIGLNDASNIFHPWGWAVEVTDASGADITWHLIPYNNGLVNSGAWIQVVNPLPGTTFDYRITIVVQAFNPARFYGLRGDVVRFVSDQVSYTHPTLYCDTFSPGISAAVEAARHDSRWQSDTLSGVRGELEKIALMVNALTYASPSAGQSPRRASDVWLSRFGDCDDLTKLQCAMHRFVGIPSRCVLSGAVPNVPDAITPYTTAVLHAFGQYWNGEAWECFEPALYENFAGVDQVLLGADEDFENLYAVIAEPPYGYPASLVSKTFEGTAFGALGSFYMRGTREIGTDRDILSRALAPGRES